MGMLWRSEGKKAQPNLVIFNCHPKSAENKTNSSWSHGHIEWSNEKAHTMKKKKVYTFQTHLPYIILAIANPISNLFIIFHMMCGPCLFFRAETENNTLVVSRYSCFFSSAFSVILVHSILCHLFKRPAFFISPSLQLFSSLPFFSLSSPALSSYLAFLSSSASLCPHVCSCPLPLDCHSIILHLRL